jgi:hypothetical protein
MKLAHVWPETGLRCIFALKGQARKHIFFAAGREDAAWAQAQRLDAAGYDVFYAPASFASEKRSQATASLVQSFWLDLDCGEGKDYTDAKAALTALGAWLKAQSFHTPTDVVLSGRGVHVYWRLASPVPPEVWQPVANRFKQALAATGLRADPARTADIASLMRMPGLHNYKYAEPLPVKLARGGLPPVALQEFVRALPKVGPRLAPGPAPKNSEFDVATEYPPANAARIATGCAVIAKVAEAGGEVEEPLWRAALSIAQRCEGKEAVIHAWSAGDPRYNEREALAKAGGTAGPATCAHLEGLVPGGCQGCKWRGKIKSPILLGTSAPEAPPHAEDTPEDTEERVNESRRYRVTASGVFKKSTEEDEEVQITACPVWVREVREKVQRGDESGGSIILLQWHSLDGRRRGAAMPQSAVYDQRALVQWAADNNLASQVNDGKWAEFKMYISEMTRDLIKRRRTQTYYDTLGWYKDTFVLGTQEVSPEGARDAAVAPNSPLARMVPKGDLETWKAGIAELNKPQFLAHQFAILASFGSPLLERVGRTSALVSLAGPTGSGKSLAAFLAGSVWTDPRLLMHTGQAVTDNAIEVHLGMLRNVPYILDESTHMDSKRLGGLCYLAVNGQGKAAVDRSRNARKLYTWSLVPFITTNSPLTDYSPAVITEAHRVRLLELSVKDLFPGDLGARLGNLHSEHCGVAAAPYLAMVMRVLPKMRSLFEQAEAKITREAAFPDKFRFALWTLAAALVGGSLARAAGLIQFDVNDVVMQVARKAHTDALTVARDEDRVVEALSEFTVDSYQHLCFWSVGGRGKNALANVPMREPRARYDESADTLYVPVHILGDYLRDQNLSLSNLSDWMKATGVRKQQQKIVPGTAPVWCFAIPAKRIGLDIAKREDGSEG